MHSSYTFLPKQDSVHEKGNTINLNAVTLHVRVCLNPELRQG